MGTEPQACCFPTVGPGGPAPVPLGPQAVWALTALHGHWWSSVGLFAGRLAGYPPAVTVGRSPVQGSRPVLVTPLSNEQVRMGVAGSPPSRAVGLRPRAVQCPHVELPCGSGPVWSLPWALGYSALAVKRTHRPRSGEPRARAGPRQPWLTSVTLLLSDLTAAGCWGPLFTWPWPGGASVSLFHPRRQDSAFDKFTVKFTVCVAG